VSVMADLDLSARQVINTVRRVYCILVWQPHTVGNHVAD